MGHETGGLMEHQLKSISKSGIPEAIAKVELYRYLNEPEEAESICRDILAVDPEHQLARRMLGLAITDQFIGAASDRYLEVQSIFQGLAILTRSSTTRGYCTNDTPRPSFSSATLRTLFCPWLRKPCTVLPKPRKSARLAMTTVFFAGIVASACWRAALIFISSADPQLWTPRICRPLTQHRAV